MSDISILICVPVSKINFPDLVKEISCPPRSGLPFHITLARYEVEEVDLESLHHKMIALSQSLSNFEGRTNPLPEVQPPDSPRKCVILRLEHSNNWNVLIEAVRSAVGQVNPYELHLTVVGDLGPNRAQGKLERLRDLCPVFPLPVRGIDVYYKRPEDPWRCMGTYFFQSSH